MKNQEHSGWTYMVIWEFRVRPGMDTVFEAMYGVNGEWVRLFERSAEFVGTELSLDKEKPGRYLTIDFWSSREAYEQFRNQHAAEYKVIDAKCEGFTEMEKEIGRFERLTIR
jgi:heme-degrading monooxygenase HmoA